jgi:hypothetical protein
MEIGPIVGIRPITMIKPATSSPDLTGVFAIEFRGQQDETYSPGNQRAARGLEDEESRDESQAEAADQAAEEPSLDSEHQPAWPRKVSFFA